MSACQRRRAHWRAELPDAIARLGITLAGVVRLVVAAIDQAHAAMTRHSAEVVALSASGTGVGAQLAKTGRKPPARF
jgi:hypothetical protein